MAFQVGDMVVVCHEFPERVQRQVEMTSANIRKEIIKMLGEDREYEILRLDGDKCIYVRGYSSAWYPWVFEKAHGPW